MNQTAVFDWTTHFRDEAIGRMFNRRDALLRDVMRSGGIDNWEHLKSHGHHHSTREACLRWRMIVAEDGKLKITKKGSNCIKPREHIRSVTHPQEPVA